jgi:hypothetical protein
MKSPPQVFNMHIPIPMPVFLELCDHREKTGCKQEIFEMAGAAVREWIAAQERKSTHSSSPPPLNGTSGRMPTFLPGLFFALYTSAKTIMQLSKATASFSTGARSHQASLQMPSAVQFETHGK